MASALRCSYQDLQGMPEDEYDFWVAFMEGETQARKERG